MCFFSDKKRFEDVSFGSGNTSWLSPPTGSFLFSLVSVCFSVSFVSLQDHIKTTEQISMKLERRTECDPTLWDCFNIFVHFSRSDALISMKLWRISGRINLDLWIFSCQSLKSLWEAGQTRTWRWRDKTPGCTLSSRCKSCPGELRRKVDVYL